MESDPRSTLVNAGSPEVRASTVERREATYSESPLFPHYLQHAEAGDFKRPTVSELNEMADRIFNDPALTPLPAEEKSLLRNRMMESWRNATKAGYADVETSLESLTNKQLWVKIGNKYDIALHQIV